MDNHKSRKTYSFQNNNKFDRIKNKKELRLRLIKLTNIINLKFFFQLLSYNNN